MNGLITRIRNALIQAWRVHAEAAGGDVLEDDALFTCFTGAPRAMYNPTIALRNGFSAALEEREAEFSRRGLPFGFLAFESFQEEAAEAATRLGFRANEAIPAMALTPIPELPSGGDVSLVEDLDALEQHIAVQAIGFGEDAAELRAFMPPSVLKSAERYYLAWQDDTPVATAILVLTGREAGIFGVATHPGYRRRGHGRAATVAALRDARAAGCDLAYLTATPMGYPVYEALGFRTLERHMTFGRPDPEPHD